MPRDGLYIPFQDTKTGKAYNMPWDDVTTMPSDRDYEKFIYKTENEGFIPRVMKKAFTPLTTAASRNLDKYVSEPLLKYSEGQPLDMFGLNLAGKRDMSQPEGFGRTAARYGGAFSEGVGDQLDSFTSPAGLLLSGAGPVGRVGQKLAGASVLGDIARGVTKIPKYAGAATAAGGGYGLTQVDYSQPLSDVGADLVDPLTQVGFGALGMMSGRGGRAAAIEPDEIIPRKGLPAGRQQRLLSASNPIEGQVVPDFPRPPYVRSIQGGGQKALPPSSGITYPEAQPGQLPPRGAKFYAGPEGTRSAIGDVTWPAEDGAPPPLVEPQAPKKVVGKPAQKLPVPTSVDVVVEDLRNPASKARAKYSKKTLDAIDLETVQDEQLSGSLGKKALNKIRERLMKSPAMRKILEQQKGELNIDLEGLSDSFRAGAQKLKIGLGNARQKGLDNLAASEKRGTFGSATGAVSNVRKAAAALTGPDVTDMSLESFWKSGWGHLEGMGKPGKDLAKLLKRARVDTEIEQTAARAKGKQLTNAKGETINRFGGLIYERNKDKIETLLKQIKNPSDREKAIDILKEFRGANPPRNASYNKAIDAIRGVQGATKLSQFAIGNPAGVVPVTMRGNIGSTLKNIKRVLPGIGDFAAAKAEAAPSGFMSEGINRAMTETGSGGLSKLVNKLYRISGSEERMRTMATLVGRDTAESLFQRLKKNPTSKSLYKQLDDLILEDDMASVLKQGKLTPAQATRAGARMNELTQGIAEGIDLPPQWTGSATADLATQFKKYGYMQTRNMGQALKANAGKTLAAGAIVAPVVGEAIGDVKAIIRGAVKGVRSDDEQKTMIDHIMKEIYARGSGGGRIAENASQAWALGLFGDLYKGVERGAGGLAETLAGPTIGDLGEASQGVKELLEKGQSYRLERQLARMIPVVGTGLSSTIKGSYVGRQKRRVREAR